MMQDLVGIVRDEREMQQALAGLQELNSRAARAGVTGHREYNGGWHTALDLGNLLTVSEAIARSAIERKESRGGHFRQDYPEKDPAYATFNIAVRRERRRRHGGVARADSADAGGAEAGDRGEQVTTPNFQLPTPKALPTPEWNRLGVCLGVGRWECLGVGSWRLGVD